MPTQTVNGFKHYYEDQGTGDPLIMLAIGAPSDSTVMARHLPDLSKDFRVIIPEARGHAKSQHVAEMPASAWKDDVLGLMDVLGLPSAHLYGEAMGSRVAMRFAIDHPERVKTLSLCTPIIYLVEEGFAFNSDHMFRPRNATPQMKERFQRVHGDDWEDVVNVYIEQLNSREFNGYYDLRDSISRIKAPTLIMRGDSLQDPNPIRVFDHVIDLHKAVPDSRLFIWPNGQNHLNDSDEEFRAVLRKFLLAHR